MNNQLKKNINSFNKIYDEKNTISSVFTELSRRILTLNETYEQYIEQTTKTTLVIFALDSFKFQAD